MKIISAQKIKLDLFFNLSVSNISERLHKNVPFATVTQFTEQVSITRLPKSHNDVEDDDDGDQ